MQITSYGNKGPGLIDTYGDGGFRISGIRYEGSVIIHESDVAAWAAASPEEITVEALDAVFGGAASKPEILIIGAGPRFVMLPVLIRQWGEAVGIAVDIMDTGAAARTFNILRQESRSVAAALIAVA